jgi:acetyl/propionyl-CoA carboxylase alpha subunit
VFTKVLVANRGEIAVRVLRTLEELGIRSVAVASEADRSAAHALAADEVHIIGPAAPSASYLDMDVILDTARKAGCQAIHPGYGFLSENPAFAEACESAGIAFIGPPSSAIRLMGSKTASREIMQKAGVPVVPGLEAADDKTLIAGAKTLGWPVLIKPVSGGGGKGMRVVESAKELAAALALSRSEAERAFGDGSLYLERYLERPRHVEIQIFGDASGRVFHVGERECSVQRRHQKILEETPSPAVDADLRARMGEAAVRAAEAVSYRNAGTVEFLLAPDGSFYFLEMNTRLQVEHPVTEMVYGVDLVAAQLATAAGEPLPFDPGALAPRGHAIEARVYAEDPAQGFLPQIGPVLRLRNPERPGVRVDSGLVEGGEVLTHYDPLLAKVVAWGGDRETSTRRLATALREMTVLGVTTNIDFLVDVLELDAWKAGALHTGFLDEHVPSWTPPASPPRAALAVAAEVSSLAAPSGSGGAAPAPSPWTSLGSWTPLGRP